MRANNVLIGIVVGVILSGMTLAILALSSVLNFC